MTVYLDSSALVACTIFGEAREVVIQTLRQNLNWFSSALSISEAIAAIARITDEEILQIELENSLRQIWDYINVIPIDQQCLDLAATISRKQLIKVSASIHLAAASRIPNPVYFLTFDPDQIMAAEALNFEVTSL